METVRVRREAIPSTASTMPYSVTCRREAPRATLRWSAQNLATKRVVVFASVGRRMAEATTRSLRPSRWVMGTKDIGDSPAADHGLGDDEGMVLLRTAGIPSRCGASQRIVTPWGRSRGSMVAQLSNPYGTPLARYGLAGTVTLRGFFFFSRIAVTW